MHILDLPEKLLVAVLEHFSIGEIHNIAHDQRLQNPLDFYGRQLELVELEQDNFPSPHMRETTVANIRLQCPQAEILFHDRSFSMQNEFDFMIE